MEYAGAGNFVLHLPSPCYTDSLRWSFLPHTSHCLPVDVRLSFSYIASLNLIHLASPHHINFLFLRSCHKKTSQLLCYRLIAPLTAIQIITLQSLIFVTTTACRCWILSVCRSNSRLGLRPFDGGAQVQHNAAEGLGDKGVTL